MERRSSRQVGQVRTRARREGAAFVEALIVIGLVIVCMQCIWGMYRFCMFQHKAQVDVRQMAWEKALKGCGDPDVGGPLNGLSKSATDPSDVGGLRSDSESAPSWFGIIQTAPETVSLPLPEEVFGKTAVASQESFACNEKGGKKELDLAGAAPDTDTTMRDATQTP
jgi:hypothetical protein